MNIGKLWISALLICSAVAAFALEVKPYSATELANSGYA